MSEAGAIVEVDLPPDEAFEVFTRETSAWWRADRSLDGHPGGLTFSGRRVLAGDGTEVGRVTVWEPGPRLVFGYASGEVEVRFEAIGRGTRVVLRHRGWVSPNSGHWASVLAGFAWHSVERVLLARLGEFLDAITAGDVRFFERYLTDDALLVFPGDTYTKAQCLAVMGDHPPYTKYDIGERRVVHVAESSAVLTYRAEVMRAGDTAARSFMVTSVLVLDDGEWRMALCQWTDG